MIVGSNQEINRYPFQTIQNYLILYSLLFIKIVKSNNDSTLITDVDERFILTKIDLIFQKGIHEPAKVELWFSQKYFFIDEDIFKNLEFEKHKWKKLTLTNTWENESKESYRRKGGILIIHCETS